MSLILFWLFSLLTGVATIVTFQRLGFLNLSTYAFDPSAFMQYFSLRPTYLDSIPTSFYIVFSLVFLYIAWILNAISAYNPKNAGDKNSGLVIVGVIQWLLVVLVGMLSWIVLQKVELVPTPITVNNSFYALDFIYFPLSVFITFFLDILCLYFYNTQLNKLLRLKSF